MALDVDALEDEVVVDVHPLLGDGVDAGDLPDESLGFVEVVVDDGARGLVDDPADEQLPQHDGSQQQREQVEFLPPFVELVQRDLQQVHQPDRRRPTYAEHAQADAQQVLYDRMLCQLADYAQAQERLRVGRHCHQRSPHDPQVALSLRDRDEAAGEAQQRANAHGDEGDLAVLLGGDPAGQQDADALEEGARVGALDVGEVEVEGGLEGAGEHPAEEVEGVDDELVLAQRIQADD